MSADTEGSEAVVDARDVQVRAVWETLTSPLTVAFATNDDVVLLDGAGVAGLAPSDGVVAIGELRVRGSADELTSLVDEARRAVDHDYLELGDVDVVHVDGRIELRRGSGEPLRNSAPSTLADLLDAERTGWRDRGMNYAKWTFTCGGDHFRTSPLRAAFIIDRIRAALGREHRG